MKKVSTFFFFAILFSIISSHAQQEVKMNFGAALAANDLSGQNEDINIFVQGTASDIQRAVEEFGGNFRYADGDIASVSVKKKYIRSLSEKPFVRRIEAGNPYSKKQVMSDSMLVHNRVLPVHAGAAPLGQGFKGKGVVVGIIDSGIDYNHPDFKKSNGKTRIRFLWDQTLPDSVPPQPYNYGQEWTTADIDNGKATAHLITAEAQYGHGTHVSSIAAGNGLAVNKYEGVAPEADIIFVALDFNNPNGIADAAKYIYAKAAQIGEPCAINASVGDYYGSHDGNNLEAQLIRNLITAKGGRTFVAASGNAGIYSIHVGYNVTNADTNFTWFSGGAYIAMYGDISTFKNVKFAIGADQVSPTYSFRGNTAFSKIAPHLGVLGYDTIYNGSNRICTMLSYGDVYMGVNSMEYLIYPDSTSYLWRLMTNGSGRFDAWTFDVVSANLADSVIYSPLKKYKQPDLSSNMVSSFQCLDEVITVGNYTNRNQYIDYDNNLEYEGSRIPGDLYPSSSRGPTRDGRIKPEICSPGDWTMGAIVTSRIPYLITVNSYKMAQGGYHILDGGTSNASPSVAGIAALYLEKHPNAGWQTVKDAITNCARQDVYTGSNLPDNNWGYGKADAFATLVGCSTSNNDNQNTEFDIITIYPNPTSEDVTFTIDLTGKSQDPELNIYDIVGKQVRTIKVKNTGTILLKKGTLQNGIYFCTLRDGEKIFTTKKLIISE